MKTLKLLQKLGKNYPKVAPGHFKDFLGLQVGPLPKEVQTIILALDLDEKAIDLAISSKSSFIITHHPLLYPRKTIALKDPLIKQRYDRCLNNKIAVYAYHSNFDVSQQGMNYGLLQQLGCQHIETISEHSAGAFGILSKPLPLEEFCELVNEKFYLPFSQLFKSPSGSPLIQKVGLCAGSGSGEYSDAKNVGVDIFLSGDSRHHHRLSMYWKGLHFLEIHHEAEVFFTKKMKEMILSIDPSIVIMESEGTPFPQIIQIPK